ncbi:MAG: GAF domain-containing protein [Anaerolineales bacterium]
MPSEKDELADKGLLERILEPHPNIKDTSSRQQAHLTTLVSLILAAISLFAGVIGLIAGFATTITTGLFIVAIIMVAACVLGRTENYLVGSILLVSGIILGGFFISTGYSDVTVTIITLVATIVPAFALAIVLLPLLAIIIIAVIVLITVGVLPLMVSILPSMELLFFFGLAVIEAAFILVARFLEAFETQQQDEIGSLLGRLEERVEERTRYARIAADIAQEIMSSSSLEELLHHSVDLISARFGFSYVGIFLADEAGQYVELKAAQGSGTGRFLQTGKRVKYGPPSILGWVAANEQQRLMTRITEDPLLLETELLAGNQSELGIPILSKEKLFGVMDVQSTRTTVFDNETIVVLQMLASQIATAIQNVRLIEFEQGSIQEVAEVYLAGFKIVQSKNENEIYQILQQLFPKVPYVSMFFTPDRGTLKVVAIAGAQLADGQNLPESISISLEELGTALGSDVFIGEGNRLNSLPYNLVRFLQQLQIFSVALIPVMRDEVLSALLLIGTREKEPLNTTSMQPYANLAKQIAATMERIDQVQKTERRMADMGIINIQLQTISELASDISSSLRPEEVFEATQRVFQHTTNAAILLIAEKNNFRIATSVDPTQGGGLSGLPEWLDVSPSEVLEQLGSKMVAAEVTKLPPLQPVFLKMIEQAQMQSAVFIPVTRNEELVTLLIVGTREEQPILSETAQAYGNVADLVTIAIERFHAAQKTERRIAEMETITAVSEEISTIRDLNTIYTTLHSHIRLLLGNVNFLVAIYNPNTSSISVPYMYEKGFEGGDITSIDTFPLGEGLTSILIRTKQPLMLVEDAERRAAALGAKIVGKSAKSWLGTPLIVSDEVIGALIVQNVEQEFAFDENDLRLLTTLSTQVAGAIHNAHLLEQMHSRAIQLQTTAEVARDISGSLDLGELLNKAATLICDRFKFYHAAIFLIEPTNEFAVIREATGEAGTQMKRAGHKLKVGSKSIVGYVTGSGESLIVNDTGRDATYYANPLLPETRAEAAIPLKVGQRILGALDVQSARAYSFGEEDVDVLRILADQMAIAVINSELFADTQEHLSQHRLLHHVTTAAASGTTLEESLNSATQGLQVTLGGDRVSILLADKGKKILRVRSFAGYSEEIGKFEVPYGEGITGWVAVHQQPQRINDVTQDPRYIQVGSNIRSELAIPLSYRGDLLGVLNVESDQAGAYNENDEELLGTLGGSLAAIISNARLIEQVRHQVDYQRLLFDVTSKIRRSTDMHTIMATTTAELSKALGAQRAHIKLEIEDETDTESQPGSE